MINVKDFILSPPAKPDDAWSMMLTGAVRWIDPLSRMTFLYYGIRLDTHKEAPYEVLSKFKVVGPHLGPPLCLVTSKGDILEFPDREGGPYFWRGSGDLSWSLQGAANDTSTEPVDWVALIFAGGMR